jgi:uncharacterized protein (DUF1330 family)
MSEAGMAKAYWIARVAVADPDKYKLYVEGSLPAIKTHGGRILARGGKYEALEGVARPRNVVIEFPSLQAAHDCFHSPEYQAARKHRIGVAEIELVIVEGVD